MLRIASMAVLALALVAAPSLAATITETFDSGIPTSWSIVDNFPITGSPDYSAVPWTVNDLEGMDNYTDGLGLAATASSHNHPGQYDVSLITPTFAISTLNHTLTYRINFQRVDVFEAFDTNISINGGDWITMVHETTTRGASYSDAPPHVFMGIDMGFYGAVPGDLARVEFRYYSTYLLPMVHNEYVEIDDVTFPEPVPEPVTLSLLTIGGLVLLRRRRPV